MKWLMLISILLIHMFTQAQGWQWANGVGSTDNTSGFGVSTDKAGNVYVIGNCTSPSTTFGTTTLNNAGSYIAKYSAEGNLKWCRGTIGYGAISVATDHLSNVYVAGAFGDSIMIIGTTTLVNKKYGSAYTTFVTFLAKYDSSGNFLWVRSAGGSDGIDIIYSVTTDPAGNVYVGGEMGSSTLDFGTVKLTLTGHAFDAFIAKYNPFGDVIWAKNASGPGTETSGGAASSVHADAFGHVFLAGTFHDLSISFDSATLYHKPASEGRNNAFLFKFDTAGNVIWGRAEGGGDWGNRWVTASDAAGNSYLTGVFNVPSITIGSTMLINIGGSVNMYLVKYDSLGNVLWAKNAGGDAQIFPSAIACDAYGNIFVTGVFTSPILYFDSIAITNANSSYAAFLVKYDPCGNVIYATSIGSSGSMLSTGASIAISHPDNVYITGEFGPPGITLGTTTLANNSSNTSHMFLAKWKLTAADTSCELLNTLPTVYQQDEIKIFPNPANTTMYIDGVQSATTYTLSNMIGAITQKGFVNQGLNSIDIGGLVNGIYYLKINYVIVGKVVKL